MPGRMGNQRPYWKAIVQVSAVVSQPSHRDSAAKRPFSGWGGENMQSTTDWKDDGRNAT